jgi:hypothetical protein
MAKPVAYCTDMCLTFDSLTPPWSPLGMLRSAGGKLQTAGIKLITAAHTATYTVTRTTTHCETHEFTRTLKPLNQFNYHISRECLGCEASRRRSVLSILTGVVKSCISGRQDCVVGMTASIYA